MWFDLRLRSQVAPSLIENTAPHAFHLLCRRSRILVVTKTQDLSGFVVVDIWAIAELVAGLVLVSRVVIELVAGLALVSRVDVVLVSLVHGGGGLLCIISVYGLMFMVQEITYTFLCCYIQFSTLIVMGRPEQQSLRLDYKADCSLLLKFVKLYLQFKEGRHLHYLSSVIFVQHRT
jgi:hypothetical protein